MSREAIKFGLVAALLLVIAAGFLAPIGSYTAQNSCLASETTSVSRQRLALIKGQTINSAKTAGSAPNACILPVKYTLYVL
jgi:hypothetical protein